ncbi:methyltransferase domain-containing protein [Candidatus Heimdallarchaeota archaeon]|nr:MAG: methyltransferase domain-containing protein [Candidatus Heimdallarchaeota archaeon]
MVSSEPLHNVTKVGTEFRAYVEKLFGVNLARKYFEKISTPMEDYTLHLFKKYDAVDMIIEKFQQLQYETDKHKEFSNIIITKPQGPFRIDFQEELKEIILDNRAAEMVYQGSNIFVPGVKRANKVKRGDEIKAINQTQTPVAKALALMSHSDMLAVNKGVAAQNVQSPFKVPNLEQVNLKDFPAYFQSLPAYLASINLEPQPGEKILDCCAAPGNKTLHLSELTKEEATIVAVDRSKNRIRKLEEKIQIHHLKNINTQVGDIVKLSKSWSVKFDKILIDPPCTSLGLRPRLVLNTNKKTIQATADYQKAIVYSCDELLRPGGTMIYSTCTITKEENEEVIDYANKKLGLKVIEQDYTESVVGSIDENITHPVQRFIPGEHKTVGFFICKLFKSKS